MFGNNPSNGTQNSSGSLIRPEPDASFKTSSAQSETSTTTTQHTVTFDEERKTVTIATTKQKVIHQQRAHVLEINSRKSATAEDVENFIRNMNVNGAGAGAGTSNFRGSSGNAATTQPTFRSTPIARTVVPRLKYSYGPSFSSSTSGIAGSAGSLGYSRVRAPTTPTVGRTEETTVVQNRGNTLTERTEIKLLNRTSYGSSAASNALALATKTDAKPFGNSVAKLGTSSSTSITRSPTNSPTGTIPLPSKYSSDKPHPGQCFIFNHVEFDSRYVSTREGSDVDAVRLRKTFEYLMLEVSEHRNPTLAKIAEQIQKITDTDYSAYACLVIVILSHGDRNEKISAKDGLFSLNDKIVFPILKNPTLKGKPKLFFIQTCKGVMEIEKDSHGNSNKEFGGSYDNILKCYSTFEGYVSYRHRDNGTYFIQALCEELVIHGTSETIENIMDCVRKAVEIKTGGTQIPSITHTMLRKFSFGDANRKLGAP